MPRTASQDAEPRTLFTDRGPTHMWPGTRWPIHEPSTTNGRRQRRGRRWELVMIRTKYCRGALVGGGRIELWPSTSLACLPSPSADRHPLCARASCGPGAEGGLESHRQPQLGPSDVTARERRLRAGIMVAEAWVGRQTRDETRETVPAMARRSEKGGCLL